MKEMEIKLQQLQQENNKLVSQNNQMTGKPSRLEEEKQREPQIID